MMFLAAIFLSFSLNAIPMSKLESYCYSQEGKVKGRNIDKKLRVASLTKLFTSYWALERLGVDFQYKTKFVLGSDNRLYIYGDKDPYFLEHGIFYLLSELNNAGIRKVREVVFDKDFYFHFKTKEKTIQKKLVKYFNTINWNQRTKGNPLKIKDQFIEVKRLLKKRLGAKLPNVLTFSTMRVSFSNKKPTTIKKVWELPSIKLIGYLKILNSYSNNMTSEETVSQLGGMSKFNEFFKEKLKLNINFYTGSGLNEGSGKFRKDNYATCRDVLVVLAKLREVLKANNLSPQDLLPMASKDVGTLTSRFGTWKYKDTFAFKTGTLKQRPTSALAAMHISKSLNFVSLAQSSAKYQVLKKREVRKLDYVFNNMNLKAIENSAYEPQDFLMFDNMQHNPF